MFYERPKHKDGLSNRCKTCLRYIANSRRAKNKAESLNAIPSWADLNKIAEIHEEAQILNEAVHQDTFPYENRADWFTVDHIVPLGDPNNNKTMVCGFHVDYNLQVITRSENSKKRKSIPKNLKHIIDGIACSKN